MALNLSYDTILDSISSFQMVRTNPKLTGNVKITVDSSGDIWLNSIDANEQLAKREYKKFPISIDDKHGINLRNFFNGGKTPLDIIFDVKQEVDDSSSSTNYADQFDFSGYTAGAKYLISRHYEERFTYFAPLYLKQDIPEYFVIFKVEGPLNNVQTEAGTQINNKRYFKEILRRMKPIYTVDLSENTNIGRYIKSIFNDVKNNNSNLDIRFSQNNFTMWNGYSLTTGSYTSKGENLNQFMSQDDPLKVFEKYITTGYERLGLINPHILNLEFLFEDEFADYYEMNRYIGFYVNKFDISSAELDLDRLYDLQTSLDNSPTIKIKPRLIDETRVMTNTDGIKLPVIGDICDIDVNDFVISSSNLMLPYVTGRDGSFYTLDPDEPFEVRNIDDFSYAILNMRDTEMDVGNMYGTGRVLLQQNAVELNRQGRSFVWMEFTDNMDEYDYLLIYHINGSKYDETLNKNYDQIQFTSLFEGAPRAGDYYVYENYLSEDSPAEIYDLYYVNGSMLHGQPKYIATALAGALGYLEKMPFNIYTKDGKILLVNKVESNQDSKFFVKFISTYGNSYSKISINGYTGSELNGEFIYANGGSDDCYRVKIDAKYYDYLSQYLDDTVAKSNQYWEKLYKISYNVDAIDDNGDVDDIFDNIVLCIEKTYTDGLDLTGNLILLKHEFNTEFGLFSFYPLKDFDMGFSDTTYNRMPLWEIYKYFYIPPNTDLIQEGVWYIVVGDGNIEYNGTTYNSSSSLEIDPSNTTFQGVAGATSYNRIEGDAYIVYSNTTSGSVALQDIPLYDGDNDISRFNGYFAIRDPYLEKETSDITYDTRDVFFDNMLTSEYHYYRENFVPELALDSRLVPYISKWGYVDGKNARDSQYRLNNHISFGINNFAPDHFESAQNPLNMTHEWYYLVSDYDFISDTSVKAMNYSYFDEMIDVDLTSDLFTDSTRFDKIFTYAYADGNTQYAKTQERYSYIKYNKVFNRYETFFRGVKIVFNERDLDNDTLLPNGKPAIETRSKRFDGYRFSVVLIPRQEDIKGDHAPITYKFYESKENKFILFIIELYLGDVTTVDTDLEGLNNVEGDPNYYRTVLASSSPGHAVDGDYRITFNQQEISDLTYLFLYSVHNKKFNSLRGSYSTIKLSDIYDMRTMQSLGNNTYFIKALDNPNFDNYHFNVSNEIQNLTGDAVLMMDYLVREDLYFNVADITVSPTDVFPDNPIYQTLDRGIKLRKKGTSQNFYLTYGQNDLYTTVPTIYEPTNFRQLLGGMNYYKNIFSMISFAEIKEFINTNDGIIEYLTWGSGAFSSDEFYVEIVSPDKIIKTEAVVPLLSEESKSKVESNVSIGFDLYKQSVKQGYEILRYSGEYEPMFKDVVYFDKYVDLTNNGETDIFMSNIKFAADVEDFGNLKNVTHLKISDKSVLTFESDLKLYPVYELIDEITIGNADQFYFISNWDYGYHKKYTDKVNYVDVHGSVRIAEDYNYMAKLIKLKSDIEITDFEVEVYENDTRTDIDSLDFDDYEIVVQDNPNNIRGYVNVKNALIRYLYEDGIYNVISYYLANTVATLNGKKMEQYVEEYIEQNLIQLYEVYFITFLGESYNNDVTASTLFSTAVTSASKEFKGIDINKIEKYLYKFTYTKRDGDNTQVKFKAKIKLI